MRIKVGDNVRVITGSNKGKEGKVLQVLKNENKVVIDGVNVVKKHVKPNRQNESGGILEVEAPIHASNVKLIDKKAEKAEKKETNKVLVDGVNIVKKHVKPNRTNESGGILETEAPIHISNVKVLDKKEEKKTEKKTSKKKEEKESK